jgi:hypothetical protein
LRITVRCSIQYVWKGSTQAKAALSGQKATLRVPPATGVPPSPEPPLESAEPLQALRPSVVATVTAMAATPRRARRERLTDMVLSFSRG